MTGEMAHASPPDSRRAVRKRKLLGLAFLVPPVTVFALFAVAEGIGLESGWWGHVLQLTVAAAVGVLAWVRPRIGGPLLILAGIGFTVSVLLLADDDGMANLSAIAIVFLPLIVAGVFFTLAGNVPTGPESQE